MWDGAQKILKVLFNECFHLNAIGKVRFSLIFTRISIDLRMTLVRAAGLQGSSCRSAQQTPVRPGGWL